jgi:hypothetical protein
MKRLMVNLLVVAACLILCVGCSTVKPAQEQPTDAVTSPAKKQASATHDYPMEWFVRGWLLGEAPPPDFPEGGNKGGWGWYYVGVMLQILGQSLNK